jgi:hypothetical protein
MGKHVFGDVNRVCGGSSSFEEIRGGNYFYVDKSLFIEHFLSNAWMVNLIARPRRFGKSLNMDMLRRFLTDAADNRQLFGGLAVERSNVWKQANSAPVFYFDFKGLTAERFKEQLFELVYSYLSDYDGLARTSGLKRAVAAYLQSDSGTTDGIRLLTQAAFEATGKRSYVLIDEYDKLLIDKAGSDRYPEIREFMTYLFSAAFKGNDCLKKGLLTGVMRISYESMFSGLNNIKTFDVFGDGKFASDYGFTGEEMGELSGLCGFDLAEVRDWYNGFRIGGVELYNTWSVINYVGDRSFAPYWGKSGTMDVARGLLSERRMAVLADLMLGGRRAVRISPLISIERLNKQNDAAFYSLLAQAGYLSLQSFAQSGDAIACIPNLETEQIWRDFIAQDVLPDEQPLIAAAFEPGLTAEYFSELLGDLISNMLSYHDLVGDREGIYHVFVLGVLSALASDAAHRPKSSRESGGGRYDIWMERNGINYIFEFKRCDDAGKLEAAADAALRQIEKRGYGAELDGAKPLWKIGIAFCGKECNVKCRVDG